MNQKSVRYILSSIILCLTISGCIAPKTSGERDKTNNVLINRELARVDNWQQIVEDSPFQVSEETTTVKNPTGGYESGIVVSYNDYPCIQGSTVCIPMGVEFARQHLRLDDNYAEGFALFPTTAVSYDSLIHKKEGGGCIGPNNRTVNSKIVDLILVTEPSDDELLSAEKEGITLMVEPICWDAFVFITHKDNPVNSLTIEQIQKIYTGEITNWNEVGGLNQEIIAYQREPNSGSQTTMEKQVMNGLQMINPPIAKVLGAMNTLVVAVSEYENEQYSIGYTFKFYVDALYVNDNIKDLEIEGIVPTEENIRNNSYPLSTNYFAVYRSEDENGIAGKFVEWILSEEGQQCIAQAGYCPLNKYGEYK